MFKFKTLVLYVSFACMPSIAFSQSCPDFTGHHSIVIGEKGELMNFDLAQVGCDTWTFSNGEFVDEHGTVTKTPGTKTFETDGKIHSDQYYGGHERYCMKWMPDDSLQELRDNESSLCNFSVYFWQKNPNGKLERVDTNTCMSTGYVLNSVCKR